jgi:hypothetical protein
MGPIGVPGEKSIRQIAHWRTVFSAACLWLAARSVLRNLQNFSLSREDHSGYFVEVGAKRIW